jgi:hypothetical protein
LVAQLSKREAFLGVEGILMFVERAVDQVA